MTKKLIWRLGNLPTVAELQLLVNDKIITKEEQREILFKTEDAEDRDKKSLESEVKFLRELVEKLSNSKATTIIDTIRYIEKPYYRQPWYHYYDVWCGGNTTQIMDGSVALCNATQSGLNSVTCNNSSFSNIKTF